MVEATRHDETGPNFRARLFESGRYALWTTILAPVSVVLHELGHFVIGFVHGYPVRLRPSSVGGGPRLPGDDSFLVGLGAFAGPLVSVLLAFFACAVIARFGPRPPFVVIAVVAPLRSIVIVVYLVFQIIAAVRGVSAGTPNFDEFNAATAWNLPVLPVAIVAVALMIGIWVWTLGRLPRRSRWPPFWASPSAASSA